jgi:hypothetical protein
MRFHSLLLAVFPSLAATISAFPFEATATAQESASGTDDGLTLAEVIQSLPLDPASIATLVLLLVFVGGVMWFGTRSRPDGNPPGGSSGSSDPR